MKFSESLWQAIHPIFQQIIEHPFNVELAKGTLDKKRFLFYLEQDAYYLISFSKALALIAGRSRLTKTIYHFLNFSLGALVAERELHSSFLSLDYPCDRIEPTPSCMAYTQYLIATAALEPIEEAVAAVLPCFWIYKEVGQNIRVHSSQDNPYIRWIETYSSQEFSNVTNEAIYLLNELACRASFDIKKRMKKVFEYSALFEWHFWDHAYNMIIFTNSISQVYDSPNKRAK